MIKLTCMTIATLFILTACGGDNTTPTPGTPPGSTGFTVLSTSGTMVDIAGTWTTGCLIGANSEVITTATFTATSLIVDKKTYFLNNGSCSGATVATASASYSIQKGTTTNINEWIGGIPTKSDGSGLFSANEAFTMVDSIVTALNNWPGRVVGDVVKGGFIVDDTTAGHKIYETFIDPATTLYSADATPLAKQ